MPDQHCVVCRALTGQDPRTGATLAACADCRMHYRPLLLRACTEPGCYVLSLREEGLVVFGRAQYCADGVFTLEDFVLHRFWAGVPADLRKRLLQAPSLEIRHEDIAWMTSL